MKVAVLVHRPNCQEPVGLSQDGYHPNPASPPRLSWGHCCSGLSPNPGYAVGTSATSQQPQQTCSLQQPAIKHRGQSTTAHPEPFAHAVRGRSSSRKPPRYHSGGRHATCIARHLLCGQHKDPRGGTTARTHVPKMTPPWRVRCQRCRRRPICQAKSEVFNRNMRPSAREVPGLLDDATEETTSSGVTITGPKGRAFARSIGTSPPRVHSVLRLEHTL